MLPLQVRQGLPLHLHPPWIENSFMLPAPHPESLSASALCFQDCRGLPYTLWDLILETLWGQYFIDRESVLLRVELIALFIWVHLRILKCFYLDSLKARIRYSVSSLETEKAAWTLLRPGPPGSCLMRGTGGKLWRAAWTPVHMPQRIASSPWVCYLVTPDLNGLICKTNMENNVHRFQCFFLCYINGKTVDDKQWDWNDGLRPRLEELSLHGKNFSFYNQVIFKLDVLDP